MEEYVDAFLASALNVGGWSVSLPSHSTSGEGAFTVLWIRGCVGPIAGLDAVEKRRVSVPAGEKVLGGPTRIPSHNAY
jgi:hypothetical protein